MAFCPHRGLSIPHRGLDPRSPDKALTLALIAGTLFLIAGLTRDLLHTMLQGIVYILTNKHNTTLYTGVTRDLLRRVAEHKLHINQGFTAKYNIEKLVYYEVFDRLDDGVHREKQLKKWHRDWKEKLINDFNPEWKDLAETIGVDAEYIQAVKEAYECGQYAPGDSVVSSPHSDTFSPPHSGLDPESHEIAGQARDEGQRSPR